MSEKELHFCGLEPSNCPYRIPYDMAEHERKIRADERAKTIDEFYNRLLNYKCEINTANYPWNYIWLVDTEMKGGAE